MKICRLCLSQDKDTQENLVSVLNTEDTVQKIKECVSVEITSRDDLPTTACHSCIQKVEDWWSFRKLCLKSNTVLQERSQNKYKGNPEWSWDEKQFVTARDEQTCDPPENTYTCEICLKQFTNCLEHLDHQSTHDGAPLFKCDKCEKVFTSRASLVDHDRNHKLPCPKCGKMILRRSMKLHLIKHTDRHMCMQCLNRFNSHAALQQHIITNHTNRKDYICETCGKRFSSKTATTVHLRSHKDERLYGCKVCKYAGRTASALHVHMSTHAKEQCVCEICSKIFKSNRNLNDHLRRVHCREKKHQCQYCDKRFVDKFMLTVHVRCHTGVRPYVCKICNKAFIRSDGLKEHMAMHGKRVWYSCDRCQRKFVSKKGMTRHQCRGHEIIKK